MEENYELVEYRFKSGPKITFWGKGSTNFLNSLKDGDEIHFSKLDPVAYIETNLAKTMVYKGIENQAGQAFRIFEEKE